MAIISTTNEGMTASAKLMRDTETQINTIISTMDGYVQEMNFQAKSADKFRTAMSDWRTRAETIVKDLENMATRLSGGGDNILTTETSNQSIGTFF